MTKPFQFTNHLAESMQRDWVMKEAKKLVFDMPTGLGDRTIYVRNLTGQVHRNEIDIDVFRQFLVMTNSWMELETMIPNKSMRKRI